MFGVCAAIHVLPFPKEFRHFFHCILAIEVFLQKNVEPCLFTFVSLGYEGKSRVFFTRTTPSFPTL